MPSRATERSKAGAGRNGGPRPDPKQKVSADDLVDAFVADAKALSGEAQSRFRRTVGRVNRRTLLFMVISLASLMLVAAVYFVLNYLQEARKTPQEQGLAALAGPHSLEGRATLAPGLDLNALLPASVGPFSRQAEMEGETAGEMGALATCLLEAATTNTCRMSWRAEQIATAEYRRAEGMPPVSVTMAEFLNEDQAREAMYELFKYGRSIGRVGNFALQRVRPVDYFYGSFQGTYTFSWSSGVFIHVASGPLLADVDSFVERFPY